MGNQPTMLRPLDAGILMALQALVYAAKKSPGFDVAALHRAASYLLAKTGGVPDSGRAEFEMPLNHLLGDTSNVYELIDKHQI